ncbi:MAG: hypothetical protein ACREH3_01225, partial [Geminicoccales bacterium]
MSRHRYPASALRGDYARAAVGLGVTLGPLLLIELAAGMAIFLSALALLFAWFGWRTWSRQRSCVEVSSEAIALHGPVGRRLDWRALRRLKLAYFAPRRSRQEGWLQLTLTGDGIRPIRLDSTLEGFDQVLERAAREAAARALPLDAATAANL